MLDYYINAFATLFVTIDPVGLAPMFLAITAGMSKHDRRKVAVRATITAAGILLVFYASGQTVLNVLGISVSAFRVAGGILLFLIAIEMIFGKRQARKTETAEKAMESEAHHGTRHLSFGDTAYFGTCSNLRDHPVVQSSSGYPRLCRPRWRHRDHPAELHGRLSLG